MLKKFFSWFMCIVFIFNCSLLAFASSYELENELSSVTLKVKRTLGISDKFSNFDSSINDYTVYRNWTLKWSNPDTNITVTADMNGKIYSYNKYSNNTSYVYKNNSSFSPIFTKDAFNNSKKIAIDFLNKVLDKNESVSFYNFDNKLETNLPDTYYFSGVIKINDLDSPFNFSISVNSSSLEVTSFNRRGFDVSYVDYIPDSSPKINAEYAKSKLCETCSFKAEYALDYNSSSKIAKLYYLPSINQNYYVDAITGELINKSSLYSDEPINENDTVLLTDARGNSKNLLNETIELSEMELSNIEKLRDVLDKEEIDSVMKSKQELGLLKYSLSKISYSTIKDSDDIYCNLTYCSSDDLDSLGLTNKVKDNLIIYKYIKANAKNGDIISISTSYPYYNKEDSKKSFSKKKYHNDFLKKYEKSCFSKSKLYQKSSLSINTNRESFIYAQKRNGYFFPANNLSITINKYTGFVDSFYKTWDDSIKFEDNKYIITLEDAKELFFDSCDFVLSYINIPSKITENVDLYKKIGYNYLNKLNLSYTLKNPDNIYRIHAKTGELIGNSTYNKNQFIYKDIANCPEKEKILILAEHGIGFEHNRFNANKQLTQLDVLVFFVNALGYSFDVSSLNLNEYNSLYSIAYNNNFIKPSEKNPSKIISREELLKIMLSASEYSSVANLKNIFKCDFADSNNINPDLLGFVCVAKSLGIITGDSNNNFRPNDVATRLDACRVLYNFMLANSRR